MEPEQRLLTTTPKAIDRSPSGRAATFPHSALSSPWLPALKATSCRPRSRWPLPCSPLRPKSQRIQTKLPSSGSKDTQGARVNPQGSRGHSSPAPHGHQVTTEHADAYGAEVSLCLWVPHLPQGSTGHTRRPRVGGRGTGLRRGRCAQQVSCQGSPPRTGAPQATTATASSLGQETSRQRHHEGVDTVPSHFFCN